MESRDTEGMYRLNADMSIYTYEYTNQWEKNEKKEPRRET